MSSPDEILDWSRESQPTVAIVEDVSSITSHDLPLEWPKEPRHRLVFAGQTPTEGQLLQAMREFPLFFFTSIPESDEVVTFREVVTSYEAKPPSPLEGGQYRALRCDYSGFREHGYPMPHLFGRMAEVFAPSLLFCIQMSDYGCESFAMPNREVLESILWTQVGTGEFALPTRLAEDTIAEAMSLLEERPFGIEVEDQGALYVGFPFYSGEYLERTLKEREREIHLRHAARVHPRTLQDFTTS